jgi:nucleotide-binding universal stress UspA family protein
MSDKMKVLIAYDGSDCAEAALDDLQRAGLPANAEALVMSVAEIWLPAPPPSSYEILQQAREVHVPADILRVYSKGSPAFHEAESLAHRALTRLLANFPTWEIRAEAAIGTAARELIAKADEWKPDLIVVGSHGRSVAERFLLGSVSQGVLTHALCSVRVARGRVDESNTPVRVVIGVDGSRASLAAVREVESRTWPARSEVRVIAVSQPLAPTFVGKLLPPVGKVIEESNQADREWLQEILESTTKRLRASGLKVATEFREGNPKQVLVQFAEEWGADCIFVGSIGFSNRFERFLLGSVSASVAARAHCSVEVVRPKTVGGNVGGNNERQFEYSRN